MKERSEIILKAFLSRSSADQRERLERFLPEEERRELAKLPEFNETITAEGFTNEAVLEKVHWSWFLPTLKTFSEREQGLFLACLNPLAQEQLAQTLSLKHPIEKITLAARTFLRTQLQNSLVGPHERLVPINYLPPSPLNGLIDLSKKELTSLIDELSLHDLALELRQIVDPKTLKRVSNHLSEEQKEKIKAMPPLKETPFLSRLALDQWDGTKEALKALLHRRGLARLGIALSGEDPDLIWTICHQLDIGRGNALFKLCMNEAIPELTLLIQKQIEGLL